MISLVAAFEPNPLVSGDAMSAADPIVSLVNQFGLPVAICIFSVVYFSRMLTAIQRERAASEAYIRGELATLIATSSRALADNTAALCELRKVIAHESDRPMVDR